MRPRYLADSLHRTTENPIWRHSGVGRWLDHECEYLSTPQLHETAPGTLEGCKHECLQYGPCNALEWTPTAGRCTLRRCESFDHLTRINASETERWFWINELEANVSEDVMLTWDSIILVWRILVSCSDMARVIEWLLVISCCVVSCLLFLTYEMMPERFVGDKNHRIDEVIPFDFPISGVSRNITRPSCTFRAVLCKMEMYMMTITAYPFRFFPCCVFLLGTLFIMWVEFWRIFPGLYLLPTYGDLWYFFCFNLLRQFYAYQEEKLFRTQHAAGCAVERGEPLVDTAMAATVDAPMDLQLVLLPFVDASPVQASCMGRVDVVNLLLEARANVELSCTGARTALHFATCMGHIDIVSLLLEARAHTDFSNDTGVAALHVAALLGHVDIANLLLKARANAWANTESPGKHLQIAACEGNIDIVHLLLEARASMDSRSDWGTAMVSAANWGHVDIVNLLLEAGANTDLSDSRGVTALHHAAIKNKLQIARLLLGFTLLHPSELRSRVHSILDTMMPKQVVREIAENPDSQQQGRSVAVRVEDVPLPSHKYRLATIVQADLVGFTEMAASREPVEVVRLIEQIFKIFDDLTDFLAIYKIETVGDAYIAGMAEPPLTAHHSPVTLGSKTVLRFSLAMVEKLEAWSLAHGENVRVRVGVHSGGCVGGVVGKEMQQPGSASRRLREESVPTSRDSADEFVVFEHALHLGSAMPVLDLLESTSLPGFVQISTPCMEAVQQEMKSRNRAENPEHRMQPLEFRFLRRTEPHLPTSKGGLHSYAEVGGPTYFLLAERRCQTMPAGEFSAPATTPHVEAPCPPAVSSLPAKSGAMVAVLPQLVPVAVPQDRIQSVFDGYLGQVPTDLRTTFECSWQHLEKEAKKARDLSGEPLQWFWIMHPEAQPKDAFGLLVLWLQRGATASHCVISHLSFQAASLAWQSLIPGRCRPLEASGQ
eukprot:s1127_g3.t1